MPVIALIFVYSFTAASWTEFYLAHATPPLKVGDRVCAKQCPKTCDLIVKEFIKVGPLRGSIWTEPACSGPVGLYDPADLTLAK